MKLLPIISIVDELSANGQNNAVRVLVRRKSHDGSSPLAVLAQEVYESRAKLPFALAGIAAAGVAVTLLVHQFGMDWPSASFYGMPPIMVGFLLPNLPWLARRRELLGHAIEARVAEAYDRRDYWQYLKAEARSLAEGYPNLFHGESAETMFPRLLGVMSKADDWVASHKDELHAWEDRYGL